MFRPNCRANFRLIFEQVECTIESIINVLFLKLKEFGSILFHPEESVSLSIVQIGPHLVALVCVPPFIDYLLRVYVIFRFLYFDIFQVKVQLVSK